ncbi:MAG: deoxyguanosinetriphosphate triphosphohydrolase [Clostridia bacterium]
MNVREITEEIERNTLSPYAVLSCNTRGRREKADLCELRTEFQRDRDKIIHCKAFRRLKHKTQVFITPEGDHYRTRLTHTLEVSQIGRTIARGLRLNEDLVEAMALGHDLGHTPFGHAGERALNILCADGFRHNEQSLRVVDYLEKLNLTWEVRDGILCHTGSKQASTLEGRIIKLADRIAYINHDIDDAIRGGVLHEEDIPKNITGILGDTHGKRIDTLVKDIIYNSMGRDSVEMTPPIKRAMDDLRGFMFKNVYCGSSAKVEEKKVFGIISGLFRYFKENPGEMNTEIGDEDELEQAVCDYIAGMSDRFALYTYENIYIPKSWNKM